MGCLARWNSIWISSGIVITRNSWTIIRVVSRYSQIVRRWGWGCRSWNWIIWSWLVSWRSLKMCTLACSRQSRGNTKKLSSLNRLFAWWKPTLMASSRRTPRYTPTVTVKVSLSNVSKNRLKKCILKWSKPKKLLPNISKKKKMSYFKPNKSLQPSSRKT